MATRKKETLPARPAADLEFGELYETAVKGDAAALAELSKRMGDNPELAHMNHKSTVLYSMGNAFLKNEAVTELMVMDAVRLQKRITGDNPTPLESLLAERVAMCRATLTMYEADWAGRLKGSMTIANADYLQRRIDRAHARYLSSIKALAQVRRLQLPAVQVGQVNIGTQQTNVAQPAAPPMEPDPPTITQAAV